MGAAFVMHLAPARWLHFARVCRNLALRNAEWRTGSMWLTSVFDTVSSYWNEGDLHKHMTTARRKFMPVKEIARYMVQLLRGLAHLHKHKVVHCDVSPQNVFLRRDREVRAIMLATFILGVTVVLFSNNQRCATPRANSELDVVFPQREEQLKVEEIDSSAQTVCYTCALGDFGHSYILSQHEESRSGVAHQGAGFVAPGRM